MKRLMHRGLLLMYLSAVLQLGAVVAPGVIVPSEPDVSFGMRSFMGDEDIALHTDEEEYVTGKKSLHYDSGFRKYEKFRNKIPLKDPNLEVLFGGNIKIDQYTVRNGRTLNSDADDTIHMWRQRVDFGIQPSIGKKEFGKASVEGKLVLGTALFWRTTLSKGYSKFSGAITPQDFINPPLSVFVHEAWCNINLETFADVFKLAPHSLKLGYFPHIVGRGISLGDWSTGGVIWMGFPRLGVQTYAPQYAPGILWSGVFPNNISYEIYYSPLVAEAITPVVQENRAVNVTSVSNEVHQRHLISIDFTYEVEPFKDATLRVEPYLVYYNSQRQTVDSPCDAPTNFLTLGAMFDGKVGPVKYNFELAFQNGRQTILPVAYKFVSGNSFIEEFHPGYDIALRGSMFVFDMAYEVQSFPIMPAIAIGAFSGGDYPYNDPVDKFQAREDGYQTIVQAQQATPDKKNKTFKGFLPLRDYRYRGMWANPLIMFNAGIVPRPLDLDINLLSTHNDIDTATNLVFIGGGATYYPLKERDKWTVSSNMFFYWEANPPRKWDVHAIQPGEGGSSDINVIAPANGIHGWYIKDRANPFLGTELSILTDYRVNSDSLLSFRAGIFFPGQLYADVKGMPNENTGVNRDTLKMQGNGIGTIVSEVANPGLGRSPSYGFYTRFAYLF